MRISFGAALVGFALLLPATGQCGITLLNDFDGNGVTQGNSGLVFRQSSFSGSTAGNLAKDPADATKFLYDGNAKSTDFATSGTQSLKIKLQFKDGSATLWDRLTTSGADPVIDAGGAVTFKIRVEAADPAQGVDPIGIALGIREVDYTADPAIGSKGTGTSKGLEFLGVNGTTGGSPNAIRTITPGSWQDVVFILPQEPIASFVGNGILEPKFGKVNLEQLAFRSTGSAKPMNIYIDDLQVRTLDAVPEPGSLALLATGLLPLLGLRRKNR